MTKPKKWYLESTGDGVSLVYSDGELIKKVNANKDLGNVMDITIPTVADLERFKKRPKQASTVRFNCASGTIVMKLERHDCTKGFSTNFMGILTSYDFIQKWDELQDTFATTANEPMDKLRHSASAELTPPSTSKDATSKTPKSSRVSAVSNEILPYDQPSPTKKRKFIKAPIDEAIESARKGVMELPITQLHAPPKKSRLLREADSTFLGHLKKRMVADPSAPGACPMAVLCTSVHNSGEFKAKHKNVYEYEVLGGLHSLICKNQLATEHPDNPYYTVALADVYVGLSDEESLRLASRHNDNSHFVHRVTHRDLVEACRSRLYALNDIDLSMETPAQSQDWKTSCEMAILPKDISHTHKDNVFSQASLRKQVWDLVVQVMDLFEQSKLKAQKLRMSTLLQKPEFKQNYLAPIRTLPISDQCLLLQKVIAGETSLTELQTAATHLKQKAALKTAFAKLTNVESWDQAVDKFPAFATDDQLNRFLGIDIRKTIPKAFVSFCQRAKSYLADDASPASSIIVNGASVNVLVTEISVISGNMIRKANPSFEGAHLVITSHSENMESIAYTIKEINAFLGCYMYVVACVCPVDAQQTTMNTWRRTFGKAEVLFFANTSIAKASTTTYLTPCVEAVVVAFFTPAVDASAKEMLDYPPNDHRLNFVDGDSACLYEYLISHLCVAGSTVLDITSGNEKELISYTAVTLGRNIVSIVPSQDNQQAIYRKVASLLPATDTA